MAKCEIGTFPDEKTRILLAEKAEKWLPGNCLMLVGNTGRGKTGLALSIAKELLARKMKWEKIAADADENEIAESLATSAKLSFVNTVDLLPTLRSNIEKAETIIDELKIVQLLLFDDLGAEKPSDFGIETLYRILNARYNELKSTIVTTNLAPNELKELFNKAGLGAGMTGDRLVSRLSGWADVVILDGPDLRLK